MSAHILGVFAESRLGLVDDILVTAGWTRTPDGDWVPPEKYRAAIEINHGRGAWQRFNAIRFMVIADEAIAAAKKAPEEART